MKHSAGLVTGERTNLPQRRPPLCMSIKRWGETKPFRRRDTILPMNIGLECSTCTSRVDICNRPGEPRPTVSTFMREGRVHELPSIAAAIRPGCPKLALRLQDADIVTQSTRLVYNLDTQCRLNGFKPHLRLPDAPHGWLLRHADTLPTRRWPSVALAARSASG